MIGLFLMSLIAEDINCHPWSLSEFNEIPKHAESTFKLSTAITLLYWIVQERIYVSETRELAKEILNSNDPSFRKSVRNFLSGIQLKNPEFVLIEDLIQGEQKEDWRYLQKNYFESSKSYEPFWNYLEWASTNSTPEISSRAKKFMNYYDPR